MTQPSAYASFHKAYLVAVGADSNIIGVVRKDGSAWTALLFGVPDDRQPRRRFVTRQEAAEHLIELHRAE